VPEIGSSLRRAREARGLSLADAEKATLVRSRYLRALEEERFDDLPGGTYPRVFLRDYATFLGLDAAAFLPELPTPEPEIAPQPEPPPIRPLPFHRWTVAAVVILVAAALLLALAATAHRGGHPRAAASLPVAAARAPLRPVVQPPQPIVTHRTLARVAVLHAARGRCWILARRGSAVVWSGTLEAGRSLRLPLTQRLWLRLGAPWNLDVTVAGQTARAGTGAAPVNLWLSRSGLTPA
jgi:hypothetical protein